MSTTHRLVLVEDVVPNTPATWLARGKAVSTAGNANASTFASIAALLTQLTSDVAALDQSQSAAANKGKAEIKTRNAKLASMQKSFRAFISGVQGLCDGAPDLEHATAVAAAASLAGKKVGSNPQQDFYGKALGATKVQLNARVPKTKGSRSVWHEWQMSADGGKTWTALPGTNHAKTIVQNLTPTTIVQFRTRTTILDVTSDWSQTISIQVL